MRKRMLAILSGVAIVASTLALMPDEAAARFGGGGGGFRGGGGFGAGEVSGAGWLEVASEVALPAAASEAGLQAAVSGAGCLLVGSGAPASEAVAAWLWPVSAAVRS
jgi:hypothetical protein